MDDRSEYLSKVAALADVDLRRLIAEAAPLAVDLAGADLRGRDLHGLDLRGSDLSRSDLRGADLSGADLRGADLTRADLRGSIREGARMDRATVLEGAFIEREPSPAGAAAFSPQDARMRELLAESVRMRMDMHGVILSDPNLMGMDLHGADLRGVSLVGADLFMADLSGADLTDANLSRADLRGADLEGAVLRGCRLRDATLTYRDLHGMDLSGADLRGADLRFTDLMGTDLRGADLRGADMRHSTAWGSLRDLTTVLGGHLSDTDLSPDGERRRGRRQPFRRQPSRQVTEGRDLAPERDKAQVLMDAGGSVGVSDYARERLRILRDVEDSVRKDVMAKGTSEGTAMARADDGTDLSPAGGPETGPGATPAAQGETGPEGTAAKAARPEPRPARTPERGRTGRRM